MTDLQIQIDLPMGKIERFCRRWNIVEFTLFGSVLRDDFRPDSDVDVLVTFAPNAKQSLSVFLEMQKQIDEIFGREVDLIDREDIQRSPNYIRRKAILSSARTVYAA